MIQEYLAFGTFLGAFAIALVSLFNFFRKQFMKKDNVVCSSNCHCKTKVENNLQPRSLRLGNNHILKHYRLK